MPIYLTSVREGQTSESQRAQIAKAITHIHCDVTGAPTQFVNAYFSEQADPEAGFLELPEGTMVFVNATIRAGRTDEEKAQIVSCLTQAVVDAVDCSPAEVGIALTDIRADYCMEHGEVLPVPGTPEEQAWKQRTES